VFSSEPKLVSFFFRSGPLSVLVRLISYGGRMLVQLRGVVAGVSRGRAGYQVSDTAQRR
jgi:hypothetical protein